MRVLVTGSQLWTDKKFVFEELDWLLEELHRDVDSPYEFVLVHGYCPNGVDAFAHEWGELRKNQGFPVRIETHPADWKGPRKKGAGYARNAEMVALGADRCLAFILDGSSGSTHCSKLAEKAGIETTVHRRETIMAYKRVTDEIKLEGVRMIWRNFSGEKRLYNESGKRYFSIPLDEPLALELREIGWNVKDNQKKINSGESDELLYHLEVTVKMDGKRPPRLFLITKKWDQRTNEEVTRRTQLDEDTISNLDYAEFDNVDLIIRPFNWDVNGQRGVAAYLKTGFFFLHQDDLEKKYAHIPLDEADDMLAIEAGDDIVDVEGEWMDDEDQLALPRGNS
jgi:hypothetical protein